METKYTLRKRVGLIGLFCCCLAIGKAFAPVGVSAHWGPWMFSVPQPPPLLRLTGVLFPNQDRGEFAGLYIFPISIGSQQWFFNVEKAESLTGSIHGSSLLSRLFPMRLRFIGPKDLLQQIEKQAGPGKTFTLTGLLYVSFNRLLVTSVKVAGGETEAS